MAKLGFFSLVFAAAGLIAAGSFSQPASAGKPCSRTKFETKLIHDACTAGGQDEAKAAMKNFLKEAKKKDANATCQTCHGKLAPSYDLKPDGLKKFKAFGGE